MERSEGIAELAAALAAFQAEVKNPTAGHTATIQPKDRSKQAYSYPYADLADIMATVRPVLGKHGLSLVQELQVKEDLVGAQTLLMHESGQWISFEPVWVPSGDSTKEYGGAATYSRRYSLLAVLGLAAETDDSDAGNARRRQTASRGTGGGLATDAQARKIEAEFKKSGMSMDDFKKMVATYGVATVPELTKAQASEVIETLIDVVARRENEQAADPVTGEMPADDEAPGMDAEAFAADRAAKAEKVTTEDGVIS